MPSSPAMLPPKMPLSSILPSHLLFRDPDAALPGSRPGSPPKELGGRDGSPERRLRGRDSTNSDASVILPTDDAEEVFRETITGVGAVSTEQVLAHFAKTQRLQSELLEQHMAGLVILQGGDDDEPPLASPLSTVLSKDLLTLDMRPMDAYERAHLPNAVSVALPPIFCKRIRRNPRATKFSLDNFVVAGKHILDAWRERIRDDPESEAPTVLIVDDDMEEPTLDVNGWTVAMLLLRNLNGSTSVGNKPRELISISRTGSSDSADRPCLSRVGSTQTEDGGCTVTTPRLSITRTGTPPSFQVGGTDNRITFLYLHPGFKALQTHPLASSLLHSGDPGSMLEQGDEDELCEPRTPLSGATIYSRPSPGGLAVNPALSKESIRSDVGATTPSGSQDALNNLERSASFSISNRPKPMGSLLTINTTDGRVRRSRSVRTDGGGSTVSNKSRRSRVPGQDRGDTPATLRGSGELGGGGSECSSVGGSRENMAAAGGTPATGTSTLGGGSPPDSTKQGLLSRQHSTGVDSHPVSPAADGHLLSAGGATTSSVGTQSGNATPTSDEGRGPPEPITQVLPNLFIGSEDMCSPIGLDRLKELGVTHVLNVAIECEDNDCDGITTKKIGIPDVASADVNAELREGVAWIGGFSLSELDRATP